MPVDVASGAWQIPILILFAIVVLEPSINGEGLHPLVESLAERIKQRRAELPELREFHLKSDMAAIKGRLEGEEIFLCNQMHSGKGIRKLHLEIASLGSGLQILHCVFFPDPRYDLPIFGTDVVVGPAGVSAAIVDLSPVSKELPFSISNQLEKLLN